ncbi:hypothetical protein [Streptomyces lienomycini]|uniref:hypothetical protein n=1 Tax=Streptomyces TaxID=1883 RepID=UPI003AA7EDA5
MTKVTTPEGTVTLFTYDSHNRVTSMQRATGASGSEHTGPTWRYDYSAATPSDAGTTTVTDPEGDATKYVHNADGEVTKVTDLLGHSRHSTYKNHLTQTAVDAMGTGSDGVGGNTTTYGWDGRNNATSAKLPMGATAQVSQYQTIVGTDLPSDLTGANGRKDSFKYDTNGNTMSVTTSGTVGWLYRAVVTSLVDECGRRSEPLSGDVDEFGRHWGSCRCRVGVLLVNGPAQAVDVQQFSRSSTAARIRLTSCHRPAGDASPKRTECVADWSSWAVTSSGVPSCSSPLQAWPSLSTGLARTSPCSTGWPL